MPAERIPTPQSGEPGGGITVVDPARYTVHLNGRAYGPDDFPHALRSQDCPALQQKRVG